MEAHIGQAEMNKEPSTYKANEISLKEKFQPTSSCWGRRHSKRLSLPFTDSERGQKRSRLNKPSKIQNIKGDGNCFFRALSAEVCGSEDSHSALRQYITSLMTDTTYEKVFSDYIGEDVKTYLERSRMATEGIWASEVEISVAATLLQTEICVFHDNKWYSYQPVMVLPLGFKTSNNMAIYLINHHSHFERVLAC